MNRVVLVSNRVLDPAAAAQAGGVAVALADVLREHDGLWFGWNGRTVGEEADLPAEAEVQKHEGMVTATSPLLQSEYDGYYLGYANSVLWPVFHNRLDLARIGGGYYSSYMQVNRRLAHALKPLLRPDDTIWVHDYHFLPFAAELRALGVRNPIGFFLHIPFPPPQSFLAIPEHVELAQALAAYDLVGLQTRADVANLLSFLQQSVHGQILPDGRIRAFDQVMSIASFPVSIDVRDFAQAVPVSAPIQGGRPTVSRIIGVDRLDYTKGLPQKFRAYGRFLEKYPEYCGDVVLLQIAPPTRESVEAYEDIRLELETLAGSMNGRYGELDWVPIHYIHRSVPRTQLANIYRASKIGSVTPLRDGMNLVAKEYVAAQNPDDPGVLILSQFAGAAEELTEALIVNPYNTEEMADCLATALRMGRAERRRRHASLMDTVRRRDTFMWCRDVLAALQAAHDAKADLMPAGELQDMLRSFAAAASEPGGAITFPGGDGPGRGGNASEQRKDGDGPGKMKPEARQ